MLHNSINLKADNVEEVLSFVEEYFSSMTPTYFTIEHFLDTDLPSNIDEILCDSTSKVDRQIDYSGFNLFLYFNYNYDMNSEFYKSINNYFMNFAELISKKFSTEVLFTLNNHLEEPAMMFKNGNLLQDYREF